MNGWKKFLQKNVLSRKKYCYVSSVSYEVGEGCYMSSSAKTI